MKPQPRDARLTAINFVADAVNRALDLKEIADNALHSVLAVMKLDAGAVYVLQDGDRELRLFAWRGVSEAFARQARVIRKGTDPVMDSALAGETRIIEDFKLAGHFFETDAVRAGFVSAVFSPIRAQRYVVGLLVLGTYKRRKIELGDIDLIEVITNQIGNAMVHAQLQADLRASEEQYRTMVENSDDAIFITDADGRPRFANSAFQTMFGYTAAELAALGSYARVAEDDAHTLAQAVARLVHGEPVHNLEYRFCRLDGVWIDLECNGSVFSRDGDRVRELQFVVRDVTEAKRRQEELLRTNQQLGALLDISGGTAQQLELTPLLRLILTRAAELLRADAAYLIRFPPATEQAEVVAATSPFESLIGPRGPASRGLSGLVRQARQGRIFTPAEVQQFGYSPILRNAQVRSVLVVPLISRSELIGTLTLVRQVSASRDFSRADLELMEVFASRAAMAIDNAELVKDLQHKNNLLELLVEEAHHRIKNNLQMVSGLLQLQAEAVGGGTAAEHLRDANARIYAIAQVHNLLSRDTPEKVNAQELIETVVDRLAQTAAREATPRVDVAVEPVWLTSEQAVAVALIVNELLSNAMLHAQPAAGQPLQLRVTCQRVGRQARLSVSDNGGGFPAGFDWRNSRGQGMNIIIQLARVNLRGHLDIGVREGGVWAAIHFDLAPEAEESARLA